MASLGQAKTLGGVGSILVLLSPIPYAGAVLAIVGFIMILIAVKYIADVLGDQKIFNNMIISVVLAIIGIVVGVVVVLSAVYSLIGLGRYTYTPGTTTGNNVDRSHQVAADSATTLRHSGELVLQMIPVSEDADCESSES